MNAHHKLLVNANSQCH